MAQFFRDLRDRSKQLDVNMTDKEIDDLKKRNNRRLKQAFDDIINKYSRDFGDTGDEIDLEKEEIVVNNGHLLHMQHDQDAGKGKRTKRILTSLVTGELWDDDVLEDGEEGILTGLTTQDLDDDWEDASEEDADAESEEDSGNDSADKLVARSLSRTESDPSYETNPTSADDSNTTPQIEDSDDGQDPLSREEYLSSSKRKQSRAQRSTTPSTEQLEKPRRQEPIPVPTLSASINGLPKTFVDDIAPSVQAAERALAEEDQPSQRPRKKRRTEPILEIPIWTRPGLDTIPVPKTAWDRHWSRRRNPRDRTFDDKGNQICTWGDVQERQRRQRGVSARYPLTAGTQHNRQTKLLTGVIEDGGEKIKLEHTCLSEGVALACPACEQEGLCKLEDISEDEAVIDPKVAEAFLRDHTCLSGDVAAPCAACERENETQDEEENLNDDRKQSRQRLGSADSGETAPQIDGDGGDEDEPEDCSASVDEGLEACDWENNPDVPRPQYVTRIIKFYSKRKPFTPEEDRIMIDLVENQAKGWDEVMEAIPSRSRGQLQYRYYTELRSEQWREKQAAAREANKEQRKAEAERQKRDKEQQKYKIRAVRDLSRTVFETAAKKPGPKPKELVGDEDFQLQPLDPCVLPPPEDERPSPTFHPTVPLIELVTLGDQSHSDCTTVWRQAPRLPVHIQGVPMEPIPPLDLFYESPYPDVYPHAQYNGQDADTSDDEKAPELDESVYETLPVGLFGPNSAQGPLQPMGPMALPHGHFYAPYLRPSSLLAAGSASTQVDVGSRGGYLLGQDQALVPTPELLSCQQTITQPVAHLPAPDQIMSRDWPPKDNDCTESQPPPRSNTESPDPLSSPAVPRLSDSQRELAKLAPKPTQHSNSRKLSSTFVDSPTSRSASRASSGQHSEPPAAGRRAAKRSTTQPPDKTHDVPSKRATGPPKGRLKARAVI